jgi:hypothetical protein
MLSFVINVVFLAIAAFAARGRLESIPSYVAGYPGNIAIRHSGDGRRYTVGRAYTSPRKISPRRSFIRTGESENQLLISDKKHPSLILTKTVVVTPSRATTNHSDLTVTINGIPSSTIGPGNSDILGIVVNSDSETHEVLSTSLKTSKREVLSIPKSNDEKPLVVTAKRRLQTPFIKMPLDNNVSNENGELEELDDLDGENDAGTTVPIRPTIKTLDITSSRHISTITTVLNITTVVTAPIYTGLASTQI